MGRWVLCILAGCFLGAALSTLLAFAGMLIFYLGIYFFLLFGLLIGASLFRLAGPLRPLKRSAVLAGVLAVSAVTFGASLYLEYAWLLYDNVARRAVLEFRRLPPDTRPTDIRARAREAMRQHLRQAYPPGGFIGYCRWAATSARASLTLFPDRPPFEYRLSQSPVGWSIRVPLTALLLALGIGWQTWPLTRSPGPAGAPTNTCGAPAAPKPQSRGTSPPVSAPPGTTLPDQ